MKKIAIYLALVVVLSLSFVIPCFALAPSVSGGSISWDGDIGSDYFTHRFNESTVAYFVRLTTNAPSYDDILDAVRDGSYSGALTFLTDGVLSTEPIEMTEEIEDEVLTNDDYSITEFGGFFFVPSPNVTYGDVTFSLPGVYGCLRIYGDGDRFFGSSVTIPNFNFTPVDWADASPDEPSDTVPTGIYRDIFDILHTHIYGGAELTSDMNLVLTMLSTTACLFCFAVPFMVVWFVIKRIT